MMKDKDPVDLAEIQRDLDEFGPKYKRFEPDEDTEYDQWVQQRYFKDKLAVLEVFKSMHKDSIEDTVEKVVRLIDKARRHG
tara:strand:- start:940 stop:1182 length:243 start_codon:yes stop_codon:yes gene_type:complete